MSHIIKVDPKTPYTVNDQSIATMTIKPVGFVAYGNMLTDAAKVSKTDAEVQRNLFRVRLKRQLDAATSDGKVVPLDDISISRMPLKLALAVKNAFDTVSPDKAAGEFEVISEGDGIVSSIIVKLGSPIKGASGVTIGELEFVATTLGALEDAVISDNAIERTVALIGISRPVGADITLMTLPTWAIDQITLADGIGILTKVTPSFFD